MMPTASDKPSALVVNDDASQLRLAAGILERDGFEVIGCLGAEDGLASLKQRGSVDVIVTDLYMPRIDGWRFCRLLRSSAYEKFNSIPILVVSAIFSGSDTEELTVQLGADGFLAAPYEPAMLCRVVRGLIANSEPVKSNTVLIVEPEPRLAQQLAAIFESKGYGVTLAVDGKQALSVYRQEPRQIVVLDYDYPEVLTQRLIDTIKEPGTATVVMVITSDNSADLAVDLIRKGADNYIHKPLVRDHLLQLCETAVRQRALLRIEELLQIRTRRLRDSEERYRSLFENAGDGIVTHTLDGVIISVNRALETLLATSRDNLAGKAYGKLMTPASWVKAKAAQEAARTTKDDSWGGELELARADGVVVPVESHCRFLRGKDAEPSMVMATYRDLTAERKLERQRAEFTAMLAHDIRNPIGLIRGCTELLLDDRGTPIDATMVRKCHERIHNAARVVDSLVSNYLELSRIEAGSLNLSRQRVDLAALLRRIVERFEGEAQTRAIRFELFERAVAIVNGDALALDRVFANLLNNAFKFTPDGGRVSMSIGRCARDAVIEVSDSGPGIDPKKLPTLFEKFNRIEITERQEGVGLGLYIVREFVGAHGGHVQVASVPGEGSRFSVMLPLAAAEEAT